MQSQTDRDLQGLAARRDREREAEERELAGDFPDYVEEDLTAQFRTGELSCEQYTERRGKTPTPSAFFRRIEHQNTVLLNALIGRGKERRALVWKALALAGAIVGLVSTIVGAYLAGRAVH